MTRSKRLAPVQDVMDQRVQKAADEWAQARSAMEAQEARLQQLIDYRTDYHKKFHETLARGAAIARMTDFQLFLQRLDVAIEQQRQRVTQAQDVSEHKRQQWLQHRMKSKAVETVVGRYRKQEQLVVDKREQKEFDEIAQRTSQRKDNSDETP